MRIGVLALFVCLIIGLGGCGGAGKNDSGSSSTSLVPEQYLADLRAAIETRDRDFIATRISDDYLDDCQDKQILLSRIMSVLGTGGTIEFLTEPPTNKKVNELRNTAEFDGGFSLTVTQGAETRNYQDSGRLYLRRDNTPWQLDGNRECPR